MVVESDELLDESCLGAAPLPQESVHVRLDVPRMDDLADIVFLANNRKIACNLASMPYPFTVETARRMVEKAQFTSRDTVHFAIRLKSTGRFIGSARYGASEQGGPVQIGYWLGESFWGNGYSTEAVHALVDHAFTHGTMGELGASCRVTNPASRRVLIKSGFHYLDQSLIHSVGAGGTVPVERYILDRKTWASLKSWRSM